MPAFQQDLDEHPPGFGIIRRKRYRLLQLPAGGGIILLRVGQLAEQPPVRGIVGGKRHRPFEQVARRGALARHIGEGRGHAEAVGVVAILGQAIEPRVGDVAMLATRETLLQVARCVFASIVFVNRDQQRGAPMKSGSAWIAVSKRVRAEAQLPCIVSSRARPSRA